MSGQITSIESQKKPGSRRVNLFVDGRFAFSLGEELAAGLSVGYFLSDPEIGDLQHRDSLQQVYNAALTLLSYRARSVAELRSRLHRRGFEPSLVEEVLGRLQEHRILDDRQFAQFWVENRQTFSPRGGRLLQAELRWKGVDREVIDGVLPTEEEEEAAAYRVAARKARSLKELDWPEFRKRLGDHLVRRGFGYDTAASTTRRLWAELNASADPAPDADWQDEKSE